MVFCISKSALWSSFVWLTDTPLMSGTSARLAMRLIKKLGCGAKTISAAAVDDDKRCTRRLPICLEGDQIEVHYGSCHSSGGTGPKKILQSISVTLYVSSLHFLFVITAVASNAVKPRLVGSEASLRRPSTALQPVGGFDQLDAECDQE